MSRAWPKRHVSHWRPTVQLIARCGCIDNSRTSLNNCCCLTTADGFFYGFMVCAVWSHCTHYGIRPIRMTQYWGLSWGQCVSFQIACAPREDSDQPVRKHRLIRVFTFRLKILWISCYPQSAPQIFLSDCAEKQADLSLRRAHMQNCRICAPAYFLFLIL